jgi:hypothetical protein
LSYTSFLSQPASVTTGLNGNNIFFNRIFNLIQMCYSE